MTDQIAKTDLRDNMSAAAIQPESSRSEPPTLSIAELDQDPHGVFRRYRPVTPLIRREDGSYIVICASDVERLSSDPRVGKQGAKFAELRGFSSGPLFNVFRDSMLQANGAEHRKRRAPMSRTFAFRIVTDLRPRIRSIAEELIESCYADGEMNFLDRYAALIPARTISHILGIPEADIPKFTNWVYRASRAVSFSFAPEEQPEFTDATGRLTDYVAGLLADRRASPRDDFLTSYTKATDAAGELSPEEILAQVVTVIIGGSDTTRAAMAIQVALLLQHRDQWEAVCQDATLVPGAVLEALRFEPSVAGFTRITLEDIEIGGFLVPACRLLSGSTMSAMRDPAIYAEPDSFNIRRTDHPRWHPVFGGGAHRCLGEALAKAELEEGLSTLAARIPQLELAGEPPKMQEHSGIRPISGMRVAWPVRVG
jgi:cytochrome P450 family 103